ncbi:PREDICTED: origin recognition complex subunit 1 [Crocodylus porosus]|uniref:Origin recognition complex subunit 1 n=1 Tax=Crocodylus porosus TaxID=8502 RepID=A0A7M4E3D7_CROPO|nr:PREDICTED: origin recognition complex subunit 1 [Crocodylus porosus]
MSLRCRTRLTYSWYGKATSSDRRLQTTQYRGLLIKSESSKICIHLGECVLIEGENADQPFVAKLLKLYEDNRQDKYAVVQWFCRSTEIPPSKQKLLQRKVSPLEIFLDRCCSYDTQVNVETIIRSVTVIPLTPKEVVPVTSKRKQTFYVKESWDGKSFKPLSHDLFSQLSSPLTRKGHGSPILVTESQVLPLDIICSAYTETERGTRSATKNKNLAMEIESRHSASKSSLSKERHSQRLANGNHTPGARKKLQLNSPTKSPRSKQPGVDDWDCSEAPEPLATKRKVTFTEILGSPTKMSCTDGERESLSSTLGNWSKLGDTIRISPFTRDQDSSLKTVNFDLKGNSTWHLSGKNEEDGKETVKESKKPSRQTATPRSNSKIHTRHMNSKDEEQIEKTAKESKKPAKQTATPKSNSKSRTSLAEDEDLESQSPMATPRSRRRCARRTSALIAKQIHLLNGCDEEDDDEEEDEDSLSSSDNSYSSSSEAEGQVFCTPKRKTKSSRRLRTQTFSKKTPSGTTTPRRTPELRTPKTRRNATPRIRGRCQAAQKPASILEEARLRLHVSAVPESLPCREKEFQDIYNFVESKLIDGTGGCMYISGVPGTGKTATVHEAIHCLQQAADEDALPSFQFIEINGMKLTDPHQTYVQILKLLTGQKVTATHAASLLAKLFCTSGPKRKTTVLVVDELDLLWTRKQDVMYNLFDWPTQKHSKLIILAIANTMDLPERIMMNRVASRLGLTRMSFQPYTYRQLQQIISSRLKNIKAFEEDAIQLVSRKVAALSGDARRCLDICRRGTEICEFAGQKSSSGLVSMTHVMEAINEMFSSPYLNAVRNASLHEQTFLKAVLAEFRRSGLEEATVQEVYHQHVALCRIEGLQIPTVSEIMAICSRLGACRLLLVESSNKYFHVRVRLNISQDDIMYALKEK